MSQQRTLMVLVEESAALEAKILDGEKSRAHTIATGVNALLNQLGGTADMQVAVVGYQADAADNLQVGSRWAGSLTGRDFVAVGELAAAPLRVETRIRRLPVPGGLGAVKEEATAFPIWYEPRLAAKAPQLAGFKHVLHLLQSLVGQPDSLPPLLLHIFASPSSDGNPERVLTELRELQTPGGPPLICHLHFGSAVAAPAICYPANRAALPRGAVCDWFNRASVLPRAFVTPLKEAKLTINANARGLVYHARATDLLRFFSLARAYAKADATGLTAATPVRTLPPAPSPVVRSAQLAPVTSAVVVPRSQPVAPILASVNPMPLTASPTVPAAPVIPASVVPGTQTMAVEPQPGIILSAPVMSPVAPFAAPLVPAVEEMPIPMTLVEMPAATVTLASEPAIAPWGDSFASPEPSVPAAPTTNLAEATVRPVVFVCDRSVEDPYSGNLQNAWTRLQERANELLGQLAKDKEANMEVAVVSYGLDSQGQPDVRSTFDGPLTGQSFVATTTLKEGAIRVEEIEEQISNGIGGLVPFKRKKPIYLELEPTLAAPPHGAFVEVKRLLQEWYGRHGGAARPAIVLHLTRGAMPPAEVDAFAAVLRELEAINLSVALYHLILPEKTVSARAYPDSAEGLEEETLRQLWDVSSRLVNVEKLLVNKPMLKEASRGVVINGKFDLLKPVA